MIFLCSLKLKRAKTAFVGMPVRSFGMRTAALSFLFLSLWTAVLAADGSNITDGTYLMPEVVAIPFSHNILSDEYIKQMNQGKLDLRKFAASLVERKRLFQDRWGSNQTEKPKETSNFPGSLDAVEVVSFFPEKHLDSFLAQGQLNVHQVGHSRGLCDPLVRASAEDFMIGIHLESRYSSRHDSSLHYLRPKYGFVNFLKPSGVMINPNRLLRYGQVLLVYKDEVKLRTTYSYGDSLVSYCEPWEVNRHPIEPMALTCLQPPKEAYAKARYIEAQIWGPLDLSDIKEFRVPEERTDLAEKLASTGLPVYAYDRASMELCDQFTEESLAGLGQGKKLAGRSISKRTAE